MLRCTACRLPIVRAYFQVNHHLMCPKCRKEVEAASTGGSTALRLLKAGVFGLGGGIAGAAVYWWVGLAGYTPGLLLILVGWLVGTAVFKGSEERGGLVYQLLAVLLTYLAVGAARVPEVNARGKEESEKMPRRVSSRVFDRHHESFIHQTFSPDMGDAMSREEVVVTEILHTSTTVVRGPVYEARHSPLSALIYGCALYVAWRRNKRSVLSVVGPFQWASVSPAPANEAARGS
ncbi:hypothetical protein HI113_01740 [Corallococcus exiguus]|uniref:hypothetical protein n=1 Tax=Corallococcus exiguus TaxID=83462 RepID=UPI0014725AE3|nr:hypothetical protein [Corallococcus exiguus]NNB89463.1 hypothetical protein [Corallococcus exiguus]NNB92638.1 hypothetical protein [Corallococcus exiguus]